MRKNAKPGPLLFRLELTGLGSFRLGNRLDWSFNLTPVYLMYQSKSDCQSIVIKLMNFPTLLITTQNSNSLNQMSWYWCKKVKSCKKKIKSCLVAIVGHPPKNALYNTMQMVMVDSCDKLIICFLWVELMAQIFNRIFWARTFPPKIYHQNVSTENIILSIKRAHFLPCCLCLPALSCQINFLHIF